MCDNKKKSRVTATMRCFTVPTAMQGVCIKWVYVKKKSKSV